MNTERRDQGMTIIIWIVGFILWFAKGWWYVCGVVLAMHLVEVFVKGLSVGKKAGKSVPFSILMTLVFGYTWWLPLQRKLGSNA